MSNPTTPFSWQMPTATDLVTDLPADFAVFGQAVATSMQYLLGGTTGQILSKTSATDMAFTWINNDQGDITAVTAGTGISGGGTSGAVTVTNSMATAMTTSGDLVQATGSGTFARLATGTSGQYLTTNGTTNSWATPPAGYSTYQLFTSSTTWTVPAGITKCAVYAVGGGAGGGSGAIQITTALTAGGYGGAAGNVAMDPFFTVTPAANITVTVGAGGTGGTAVTSVSTASSGNNGTAGTDSVFGSIISGGATTGVGNNVLTSNAISSRLGGTGGGSGGITGGLGIPTILTQAGSLGSNGVTPTVGTILGTGGTSTTAGFAGGGGGGGNTVTTAGGVGIYGGGSGGGCADSATNITTTGGAGGAGATNRGAGGGGGGAAKKVGTTTTSVTSGVGGNGGSGFVAIFY